MKTRNCTKVVSMLLAVSMFFSAVTLNSKIVKAAGTNSGMSDLVQVSVDSGTKTFLNFYADGVYETEIDLVSGLHAYEVYVNGSSLTGAVAVNAAGDQKAHIRYYSRGSADAGTINNVVDSINNPSHFKSSATWVGTLDLITGADFSHWDPEDTRADLDYIGGGRYQKTFNFPALLSDISLEYNVAFEYVRGAGGDAALNSGIESVSIPAGATEITIYADYLQGICADSINHPALSKTVSLIGSIRTGNDDSPAWELAATGWEFNLIDPVNQIYVYSGVFDAGTYEYKSAFNYSRWWDKRYDNITITISNDDTQTLVLYDGKIDELYDCVNHSEKLSEYLGFILEPVGSTVTTNSNGTTKFTIGVEEQSAVVKLYYTSTDSAKSGSVDLKPVYDDSRGTYLGKFTTGNIFLGDEAIELQYWYEINGSNSSVETYTRDEFTGRNITVPGTLQVVLPGQGTWEPKAAKMTYEGNGRYAYTFYNVPAANYEYKIACNGTWDENYGVGGVPGGSNYPVTVYATQDVTIYYSDFSHKSVNSVSYALASLELEGTSINAGTIMEDNLLTGIYSVTVSLSAGTYNDLRISWTNKDGGTEVYDFNEFTLESDKDVTFYFDTSTELYYCNASNEPIDEKNVIFNSKDTQYKSIFGAVEQNKDVTFSIQTGDDVKKVALYVKGPESKKIDLTPESTAEGILMWSGTVSFSKIGEYDYFFALLNSTTVGIYSDDDVYYGTGIVTDLANMQAYDLIIYKSGFTTPDWMKTAVIYQIFPDRFYNGDTGNDYAQLSSRGSSNYEFINDWYTLPKNPDQYKHENYPAQAYRGNELWSTDTYGGDLKGITDRIDYLKSLGVNVIYLNPVFQSISTHRYDTTDYTKIDPILGTMGDFKELVKIAEENDMYIILDGVFNHVSDDSIYFDRYYKFIGQDGKMGAYPYWAYVYDYLADSEHLTATTGQAEQAAKDYFSNQYGVTDFTYTGWFEVYQTPLHDRVSGLTIEDTIGHRAGKTVYGYDGWWGYDSMPVILSTEGSEYQTPGFAEEIIDGKDSAAKYWLTEGNNGWRLDVANEVSDETWQKFRESVKSLSSDNVIIGEIWGDASNYLLGDMYDSVMNYVFRNAVVDYVRGGNAYDSTKALDRLRERYPEEAFYALMNLVDSHDTTRLLSNLDGIPDDESHTTTNIDRAFPTYEKTSDEAKQRQYVVALIQMTYPGAPTIYYGDEIGMVGADDPDDRRAMEWGKGNQALVEWYAQLTNIRHSYSALTTGSIIPLNANNASVMAYIREDSANEIIIATNNSSTDITVTLDASAIGVSTLTDILTGNSVAINSGNVTITVPAYRGVILVADVKVLDVNYEGLKPAYDSTYIVPAKIPTESVTLTPEKNPIKVGQSTQVNVTYSTDANVGTTIVSWSTSDSSIAAIDEHGVVTAVKKGTVTISAMSANGILGSFTLTIEASGSNTGSSGNSSTGKNNGSTSSSNGSAGTNSGGSTATDNNNESINTQTNTDGVTTSGIDAVPKTGDNVKVMFLIMSTITSAGLLFISKPRRKRQDN